MYIQCFYPFREIRCTLSQFYNMEMWWPLIVTQFSCIWLMLLLRTPRCFPRTWPNVLRSSISWCSMPLSSSVVCTMLQYGILIGFLVNDQINSSCSLQRPLIFEGVKDIKKNEAKIHEAFDVLEAFLADNEYVAGSQVIISHSSGPLYLAITISVNHCWFGHSGYDELRWNSVPDFGDQVAEIQPMVRQNAKAALLRWR